MKKLGNNLGEDVEPRLSHPLLDHPEAMTRARPVRTLMEFYSGTYDPVDHTTLRRRNASG